MISAVKQQTQVSRIIVLVVRVMILCFWIGVCTCCTQTSLETTLRQPISVRLDEEIGKRIKPT